MSVQTLTAQDAPVTGNRSAVELAGICKSYGDVQVVRDLDLSIGAGTVLLDAGPVGLRQDHHAPDDRRLRRPDRGRRAPART